MKLSSTQRYAMNAIEANRAVGLLRKNTLKSLERRKLICFDAEKGYGGTWMLTASGRKLWMTF